MYCKAIVYLKTKISEYGRKTKNKNILNEV